VSAALAAIAGRPPGQIGIVVRDLSGALERYTSLWGLSPWNVWTYGPDTVPERGYGQKGDGGYAYFDTRELFGIYTELIEVPEVRIPPRATYP